MNRNEWLHKQPRASSPNKRLFLVFLVVLIRKTQPRLPLINHVWKCTSFVFGPNRFLQGVHVIHFACRLAYPVYYRNVKHEKSCVGEFGSFRMRGLLGVLVAAGVMAGTSLAVTTSAEAHLFDRGGCCTVAKKVYYRQPTTTLVRKVSYERVRSYRTVWAKKLYSDRCGCRKFYRKVAVQQPTVSVVRKVSYERVRAYRTVVRTKLFRKRCCCH
jgi:hypothetical protein